MTHETTSARFRTLLTEHAPTFGVQFVRPNPDADHRTMTILVCRTCRVPAPCPTDAILALVLQARTERDAYCYQANRALDALGAQLADVAQRMMHAVTGQPATREAAVQWLHALQREATCGGPVALAAQDDPALWTWCEAHQLHYFTDDGCARCEETDMTAGEICGACEQVCEGQRRDGSAYCIACSRQDADRDDGDPGDVLLLDREPHLYAP